MVPRVRALVLARDEGMESVFFARRRCRCRSDRPRCSAKAEAYTRCCSDAIGGIQDLLKSAANPLFAAAGARPTRCLCTPLSRQP